MASTPAGRTGPAVALVGVVLALTGCAAPAPQTTTVLEDPGGLPRQAGIDAVPFYPQEAYQCGPAALATVLGWGGRRATPAELVDEVYIPARRGSLQAELAAAARRRGRVPYVLEPRLRALLAEVEAGHPVLVLQNLGLACCPRWHYAVAVGYDLDRRVLTLRSGTERRRTVALDTFERTWARGERWALVVLPPDRLPATADPLTYVRAVAELERLGRLEAAERAYRTGLGRWPHHPAAGLGLGNIRYAQGDAAGAIAAFRRVVTHHPEAAAAHNNLAHVLAEQGRIQQALVAARRAVTLEPENATYQATLAAIRSRLAGSDDARPGASEACAPAALC